MNNTIKKAAAVFAAAMTILSTSAVSAFAAAPNNKDYGWAGTHSYYNKKNNSSSVYVYNQSKYDCYINVYGAKVSQGATYSVSSCNGYRSTFKTVDVKIPSGSKREVHQFVNEKGYPYVFVNFKTRYTFGVWSADTVGNYPDAN